MRLEFRRKETKKLKKTEKRRRREKHLSLDKGEKRVFWVKIAKFKVNLRYSYCSKLIGKLRRETEFRQWCCQIGRAHV